MSADDVDDQPSQQPESGSPVLSAHAVGTATRPDEQPDNPTGDDTENEES